MDRGPGHLRPRERPPSITAAMCAGGRSLAEPRLSPNGSRVAFVAGPGSRLVVVSSGGGPEMVVTADPLVASVAPYAGGAFDWVPDGGALVYVGADGGRHCDARLQ